MKRHEDKAVQQSEKGKSEKIKEGIKRSTVSGRRANMRKTEARRTLNRREVEG